MLEWIGDHSGALNVLLNLMVVIVWLTYLHLLLMTYLRQRRSNMIVNRGAGSGVHAHCLVSNMSAEPVYVQSVIATLKSRSDSWSAAVTDIDELSENPDASYKEATNQGPLDAGEFFSLGSFAKLGERAAQLAGAPGEDLARDFEALELTVIAAYGSEKLLVAARREFTVTDDGSLVPTTVATKQVRSRRERRRLDHYLQHYM